MAEFVDAYDKTTGKKHRVPARWIDHPILGRNLAKTPRIKAREKAAPADATTAQTAEVGAQTPSTGDEKE